MSKEDLYTLVSMIANVLTFLAVLAVSMRGIQYMDETREARITWSNYLEREGGSQCGTPQ
mgnify:CR=1 FL=1